MRSAVLMCMYLRRHCEIEAMAVASKQVAMGTFRLSQSQVCWCHNLVLCMKQAL